MTNKNGNTPKPNNQVNRRDFLFALASCTAGLMLPNITHAQVLILGPLQGHSPGGQIVWAPSCPSANWEPQAP